MSCPKCLKHVERRIIKDIHDELDEIIHTWNSKHLAHCICGGTADDKFYCQACGRHAASANDWNKIVRLLRLLKSCVNFVPETLAIEVRHAVS